MKHNMRITLILLLFFFLAQIIGLLVVEQYMGEKQVNPETGEITQVYKELPMGVERPEVEESFSFIFVFFAIIVGTALAFLLIRFKVYRIWRVWFFLAVLICMTVAFAAFTKFVVIAFLLSLVLASYKVFKPNMFVHNITELFIYGGIAAIFVPVMNLFAGVMLLILISGYDAWSVWKSKHMIKLAKAQSKVKIFAGLMIPYQLPKKLKKGTKTKLVPVKSAILGGGDIGFTLLFAGIVLKYVGFWTALIIPICATIALGLLLYKGDKNKFYPAMPFLTTGCFIGGIIILALAYL